jgi:hypothetical protein
MASRNSARLCSSLPLPFASFCCLGLTISGCGPLAFGRFRSGMFGHEALQVRARDLQRVEHQRPGFVVGRAGIDAA